LIGKPTDVDIDSFHGLEEERKACGDIKRGGVSDSGVKAGT